MILCRSRSPSTLGAVYEHYFRGAARRPSMHIVFSDMIGRFWRATRGNYRFVPVLYLYVLHRAMDDSEQELREFQREYLDFLDDEARLGGCLVPTPFLYKRGSTLIPPLPTPLPSNNLPISLLYSLLFPPPPTPRRTRDYTKTECER